MTTTIKMAQEKETKGTIVYRELDSSSQPIGNNRDCVIGSLYIQKTSDVGKAKPTTINVTITY